MDDENPYAPPKHGRLDRDLLGENPNLAWRDNDLLMVRKRAVLLDRCLKCNEPADGRPFQRSLSWMNPNWIIAIFLIGPLLFIIVYLIVSKRGKVTVALCPLHRQKRARAIARGWLCALAGIGVIIVTGSFFSALLTSIGVAGIVAGVVLVLVGMIGGAIGSRVLIPTRIDKHFIWLSKVSPKYLASFPDWNV